MSKAASRSGALAVIVTSVAGFAMMALEFTQVSLGFEDTDSPEVAFQFLSEHADVWANSGLVMIVMAVALVVATFAVADVLAQRSSSLTVRSIAAAGLFAAGSLFMFGVLRSGVSALIYIDSLSQAWGHSAFLVVQMVGVHGFGQAGILAFSIWAAAVSLVGLRTRALPLALSVLGVLPAARVFFLIVFGSGRFDDVNLPDAAWVVAMLTIPGTFIWSLILGLVLLRRSFRSNPATGDAVPI